MNNDDNCVGNLNNPGQTINQSLDDGSLKKISRKLFAITSRIFVCRKNVEGQSNVHRSDSNRKLAIAYRQLSGNEKTSADYMKKSQADLLDLQKKNLLKQTDNYKLSFT